MISNGYGDVGHSNLGNGQYYCYYNDNFNVAYIVNAKYTKQDVQLAGKSNVCGVMVPLATLCGVHNGVPFAGRS
jgi:hypothetical protein